MEAEEREQGGIWMIANSRDPREDKGCASCTTKPSEVILHDLSFAAKPGQVFAIVGPRGSGRTSLLHALSGRDERRVPCDVSFHGANVSRLRRFGFVSEFLHLPSFLTVKETLDFYARLKFIDTSKSVRHAKVEFVIESMSLEKFRTTRIGGPSCSDGSLDIGGLRRVAIAAELLDDPAVLFIDEPTSGLDPQSACRMMETLRSVAATRGKTLICTLQHPRSQVFALCDSILFLARGQMLYCGPPAGVVGHLEEAGYPCPPHCNPMDHFIALVESDEASTEGNADATELTTTSCKDDSTTGMKKERESDNSSEDIVSSSGGWTQSANDQSKLSQSQVHKIAHSYRSSRHFEAMQKEMADVVGSIPAADISSASCLGKCGLSMKAWLFSVGAIWMRCTRNIFRNWKMWLSLVVFDALLGFILGCFFFQQAKGLQNLAPLDTFVGISDERWSDWYHVGVDGERTRPFFDVMELGVDHGGGGLVGSHPLHHLLTGMESYAPIHETISCIHKEYGISDKDYPPNYFPPPDASDTSGDDWQFHPNHVSGDVVTVAQIIDYLYFHMDYDDAKICMDFLDDSLEFWGCVWMNWDYILEPILECLGLPPFPPVPEDTPDPPSFPTPPTFPQPTPPFPMRRATNGTSTRWLSSSSNDDDDDTQEYFDATKQIMDRLRGCDVGFCEGLDSTIKNAEKFLADTKVSVVDSLFTAASMLAFLGNVGMGAYDILLSFQHQRFLHKRETDIGLYRTSAFVLAKDLSEIPIQIIPVTGMILIFYAMVGLKQQATPFFTFYGIALLTNFAGYGLGYAVVTTSYRLEWGATVLGVVVVLMIIFTGFFLIDTNGDVVWLKYLSFHRWAYYAAQLSQFPPGESTGTVPNEVHLFISGVTETNLALCVMMLIVLGVGYRIVGYLGLRFFRSKDS